MSSKTNRIQIIILLGLVALFTIFVSVSVAWHLLLDPKFYNITPQKLAPLMNSDKNFLRETCSAICEKHKGWSNTFESNDVSIFCHCNDSTQEMTIESLLPLLIEESEIRNKACAIVCPGYRWWTEQWKNNSHEFQCQCAN